MGLENRPILKGLKDRQQSSGQILQWLCISFIQSHILNCISNDCTQDKSQIFNEYEDGHLLKIAMVLKN